MLVGVDEVEDDDVLDEDEDGLAISGECESRVVGVCKVDCESVIVEKKMGEKRRRHERAGLV